MDLTNEQKKIIEKGIIEPMLRFGRNGGIRGLSEEQLEESSSLWKGVMETMKWCCVEQGLNLKDVGKFVDEILKENGFNRETFLND